MPVPEPRTTAILVRQVVDVPAGTDLTPYIRMANLLTTGVCTYADNPYTDGFEGSQMELIERLLAAHFARVSDPELSAAKAGTVAVGYNMKVDQGLAATRHGQDAMVLDYRGNLAAYNNTLKTKRKITVSIGWMGTDPLCGS